MGTSAPSPPVQRRGNHQRPWWRWSPRTGRTALLLAAGLLAVGAALALTLLLAWPPLGGTADSARVPASAGHWSATAGGPAPTGAVVEATEVTATPSRGEPTDVVPSGSAGSAAQTAGTTVSAASGSATPTATVATEAPAAVEITCAEAQNNVSGEVCVHTTPGAAITITITYCNGLEAHNTDLQGTRYADSNGNYTWNWVPETSCPGTATAHVTARGTDGSTDATATVTVSP